MKKIVKAGASMMLALTAASAMPVTVFAETGNIPTGTVNNVNGASGSGSSGSGSVTGSTAMSGSQGSASGMTGSMPSSDGIDYANIGIQEGVTTKDIADRLSSKGYEIVDAIRRIGLPICIGSFVIGIILAIFGALSKRATVMPGVIAMICAVVAFVLIFNAPTIMIWAARFLTTP